jgi:glycerophosphoryl diester phosphodiesterase
MLPVFDWWFLTDMKKPLIIGHRGASFYEPENTIRSINKAIELGAKAVEIDVHLSKDKELVVIHDDSINRTTKGKGHIKDLTFKQLRKFDAGKGQKIPSLQEVIDLFADKITLVIELKALGTARPIARILKKNKAEKKAYIISFWHELVKEAKALNKNINTGVLFAGCPVNAGRLAKDANAGVLFLHHKTINKKLVQNAHKEKLKVFVWNIDKKKDIKPIAKLGVDGIGSNKPDVLVKYFC